MWQKAGRIPSRPPLYHRLEKQPHTFTDNFEPPGSLSLRVSGLWEEARAGEAHSHGESMQKPHTETPLWQTRPDQPPRRGRRPHNLNFPPNGHVVPSSREVAVRD